MQHTDVDTTNLTAVVHGVIMGLAVPFPLPNPDGCVDSGVTCPLTTGNSYKYKAVLPVLNEYPQVSLIIIFFSNLKIHTNAYQFEFQYILHYDTYLNNKIITDIITCLCS